MKILVGHTGFVGSNIYSQTRFDLAFNSRNISDAYGSKPDLLVFAGMRAEKFIANSAPEQDRLAAEEAFENMKKIAPRRIVLISTIDVYDEPIGAYESTPIQSDRLKPYGLHRWQLERWIESAFDQNLIVRLPGLYGKGLKKNFLFDLMNPVPQALSDAKYDELSASAPDLSKYYPSSDRGFRKCAAADPEGLEQLGALFKRLGFSAVKFTDSRGRFQFYNLDFLWGHIDTALSLGIKKLNLAVAPVAASEIHLRFMEAEFRNEISNTPPAYDFRTEHARELGGRDGYIFDKDFVLDDLVKFLGTGRSR